MAGKILIVDDEPDLELLIRQRFRRATREGVYEFLFARNGADALATLADHPDVEVVLSDINMPVMDGLALLARLRQLPQPPAAVIVSAYGDMANIRAAMNRGAFDFLTKPIDFQDFEVTVQKTLQQVRLLRDAASARDRLVTLQRDLQTAADIQRSFLPPPGTPPGQPRLALNAVMLPARAVGGDFYDHFLLEDAPARLGLVVGDVTGKGVPAALFMAVCRTLLRAAALPGAAPGDCLDEVNRRLLRDSSSELFVSLFYGVLDLATGEFRYANGGHPPPLLLDGDRPRPLAGKGLVVGAVEEAVYQTYRTTLGPGDGLFLYTDGITEAMNPDRELFGAERLESCLEQVGRDGPDALVQAVLNGVKAFVGTADQSDDLTTLAVYFHGPAGNGETQT